jgi:hypothetical protein
MYIGAGIMAETSEGGAVLVAIGEVNIEGEALARRREGRSVFHQQNLTGSTLITLDEVATRHEISLLFPYSRDATHRFTGFPLFAHETGRTAVQMATASEVLERICHLCSYAYYHYLEAPKSVHDNGDPYFRVSSELARTVLTPGDNGFWSKVPAETLQRPPLFAFEYTNLSLESPFRLRARLITLRVGIVAVAPALEVLLNISKEGRSFFEAAASQDNEFRKELEQHYFKDFKKNIVLIQTALAQLGYDVGPADGIWGRRTEREARLFSEINGIAFASRDSDAFLHALSHAMATRSTRP